MQLRRDFENARLITTGLRCTAYGYRKNNLTAITNEYGKDIGRAHAAHRGNSGAIMQNYWQGNVAVDITSALLGEKRMKRMVLDSLAMKQYVDASLGGWNAAE